MKSSTLNLCSPLGLLIHMYSGMRPCSWLSISEYKHICKMAPAFVSRESFVSITS